MVVFTAAIGALLTGATVGVPAGGVALALSRVIFLRREDERIESECDFFIFHTPKSVQHDFSLLHTHTHTHT